MHYFSINLIFVIILFAAFWGVIGYLIYLLIKALRKYIRSEPVRREKSESARSLGEVLKKHRTECKMTQEFVAEAIGVSRQAVSKWESGASDPSTTNLNCPCKSLRPDCRGAAAGNAVKSPVYHMLSRIFCVNIAKCCRVCYYMGEVGVP